MRKLLVLLLCVVLFGSTLPITAHAQTIAEANDNMQFVSTGDRFTMVIKALTLSGLGEIMGTVNLEMEQILPDILLSRL